MGNDTINLLLIIVLLIVTNYVFIRIALKLRKYDGSLTTTMFGSTYQFLKKDKREAVEEIVEMKASKKMEEESSDKPIEYL